MKCAKIMTNDYNRMIEATKNFVNQNPKTHKSTEYIKLEFDSEKELVTAIAVEGRMMSVEHSVIYECSESFCAYIKGNLKLPANSGAVIELHETEVVIRCNGFSIGFEQPEPFNFEWKDLIPQEDCQYSIKFNGNLLLKAIKAAKSSTGGSFRHPLTIEFRGKNNPCVVRTNETDIKIVCPLRDRHD